MNSHITIHTESYTLERIMALPIGAGPTILDTVVENAWQKLERWERRGLENIPEGTQAEPHVFQSVVDVVFTSPRR